MVLDDYWLDVLVNQRAPSSKRFLKLDQLPKSDSHLREKIITYLKSATPWVETLMVSPFVRDTDKILEEARSSFSDAKIIRDLSALSWRSSFPSLKNEDLARCESFDCSYSYKKIDELIDVLKQMPTLKVLSLLGWQNLNQLNPSSMQFNLAHLKSLILSQTNINTESLLILLRSINALKHLTLQQCKDLDWDEISRQKDLSSLELLNLADATCSSLTRLIYQVSKN